MSLRGVQLVLSSFSKLTQPAPNSVPKPLKPGGKNGVNFLRNFVTVTKFNE